MVDVRREAGLMGGRRPPIDDEALLEGLMGGGGPGANALFNDPPGMEGALEGADEMFPPVAPRKRGKRRGASGLSRPGENLKPSEILNSIGWTIWGFSWLATTNAIRFLTFALLSFLLGLFSVELPALAVGLVALGTGGVAAWFIQMRITALERPVFDGHFSLSAGLALVIDLALNYSGAKFAAPYLAEVFSWNIGTLYMVLGAIGLTIMAEALMVWAIIERRKGY